MRRIGVAAPLLIVLARLIQGFSAGGEVGASTTLLVEHATPANRGYMASWQFASQGLGILLGAVVVGGLSTALTPQTMESWGWRVPSFLGMLIAPVGMYIRRHLEESLEIRQDAAHAPPRRSSLSEVCGEHGKTVLAAILSIVGGTAAAYVVTFYMPTYAIRELGLPPPVALFGGRSRGCCPSAWKDNIDLNRNHIDFDAPLPVNAAYADVEPFVLPFTWPPTADDEAAMAAYLETHGMRAYRAAVTAGQYTSPGGVFYGGKAPSWSNRTLRGILRKYGTAATHIGWMDIHTGLGPYGHGEKIYPGRNAPADLAQARAWWGADVFAPFDGQSASADVSGPVVSAIYDECPQASAALMGLEFGTLPDMEVMTRLRADAWLRRHPEAPAEKQRAIRQDLRDAFYCDNDEWKGMVLGQARVVLLQTLQGLKGA